MLTAAIAMTGLLATAGALANDVVVVEVTGEGISQDAARSDALRKALEQGGKQ